MNPETTAPPPPANPNWHRFADNVMAGKSLVDSYLAAGFQCTRASAYVNASKLSSKPVVAVYIRYWLDRRYREHQEKLMNRDRELFRFRL